MISNCKTPASNIFYDKNQTKMDKAMMQIYADRKTFFFGIASPACKFPTLEWNFGMLIRNYFFI